LGNHETKERKEMGGMLYLFPQKYVADKQWDQIRANYLKIIRYSEMNLEM